MSGKTWTVPFSVDVDKQVTQAMKRSDVRDAYAHYPGNPDNFKSQLRAYIEQTNARNNRMRNFATVLDTANKATVPIDAALDYFNIMAGVGAGARAIKTVATAPGYLAYDAYYLGKTHDIVGTLGNVGYEALSWASLGGLPHLINHYTRQADKYAVKEGVDKFLEYQKSKGLEGTVINLEEELVKQDDMKKVPARRAA